MEDTCYGAFEDGVTSTLHVEVDVFAPQRLLSAVKEVRPLADQAHDFHQFGVLASIEGGFNALPHQRAHHLDGELISHKVCRPMRWSRPARYSLLKLTA